MLYVVRQQGLVGHIQVTYMWVSGGIFGLALSPLLFNFVIKLIAILYSYRTKRAEDVPLDEQAISGRDYVSVQATVDMFDTVARVPVEVTIKSVSHD